MNALRPALSLSWRSSKEAWICPSCRAKAANRARRELHISRPTRSPHISLPGAVTVAEDGSLYHLETGPLGQSIRRGSKLPALEPYSEHEPPIRISLHSLLRKPHQQAQIMGTAGERQRVAIVETLTTGRPAEIAAMLAQASTDIPLLQSIPGTTWTEIIRHLNPQTWVPPLHDVQHSINVDQLFRGTPMNPSASVRAHVQTLSQIMSVRRSAGISVELTDYRLLLEYAARMCSFSMAQSVWRDMNAEGVTPNLDCYNALMEASLYDNGQRLRLLAHGRANKDEGGEGQKLWKAGISSAVERIFERMQGDPGIEPDTRTYCALITALSRDDKTDAVAELLKSLWNLDVRSVASRHQPEELIPYPRGHRLYPNSRLLVVLADAFGSRNDISTAFNLIDSLSTSYAIPVKRNVWHQLLMWTWLHGRAQSSNLRHRSHKLRAAANAGSLSSSSSSSSLAELFEGDDNPDEQNARQMLPSPLEERERRRNLHARFDALFDSMLSHPQSALRPSMHMLHMAVTNAQHHPFTPSSSSSPAEASSSSLSSSPSSSPPPPPPPEWAAHQPPSPSLLTGKNILHVLQKLHTSALTSAEAMHSHRHDQTGSLLSPVPPSRHQNRVTSTHMTSRLATTYLQRWTRRILEKGVPETAVAHMSRHEASALERWRVAGVPRFLEEWRSFVPSSVRYQVPGGVVEMVFRNEAELQRRRAKREEAVQGERVGMGIRARTGSRARAMARSSWGLGTRSSDGSRRSTGDRWRLVGS